jgi:TPR repeat protein
MSAHYVLKGIISDFKDAVKDNDYDKADKLNEEIKLALIDAKKEYLTTKLIKMIKNDDTKGISNFRRNGTFLYKYNWETCLDYAKIYDEVKDIKNSCSYYQLGIMYEKGYYVLKDTDNAIHYYEECADQGNPSGHCALGIMYSRLVGKESDALQHYLLAAEAGHAGSYNELGCIYNNGMFNVKVDKTKAFEYFQQAAIKGNPRGQHNLAIMYQDGDGTDVDKYKALEYFKMSADQGFQLSESGILNLLSDKKFALELVKKYTPLQKEGNGDKN